MHICTITALSSLINSFSITLIVAFFNILPHFPPSGGHIIPPFFFFFFAHELKKGVVNGARAVYLCYIWAAAEPTYLANKRKK